MTNYSLELCPIVNKGAAIHKSSDTMPSVRGYEVPLQPTVCDLTLVDGWEVPLEPVGGCLFEAEELRWEQEKYSVYTAFGPATEHSDYWIFSCSPPQGLFEGTCPECFAQSAAVFLVGNLGFSAGGQLVREGRVSWKVHRDDLPLPGESLVVLAMVSGEGDSYISKGRCAIPECGTPDSDCMWGRDVSMHTNGTYLVIASTHFATPTWTGGELIDYYIDDLGWANLPYNSRTFPICDVYGSRSLKYKIQVEGEIREVTSVGFAGYGIGTHVLLKKLGIKYNEPFSDSCLGVGKGAPAEFIEYEKIGVSDGTYSPILSSLGQSPIDVSLPITVYTNYDVYTARGWITEYMTVNVAPDGSCSGDCSAGALNARTGKWLQNIVWTHIPNADRQGAKIEIVCQYTKAKEACNGVVILPWHIMSMGG